MRIVIVEDEPQIREGLEKAIVKYTNHQVVGTAVDGLQGGELIKKENPDLVITDIHMPNMGGLEMLKELWEEGIKVHSVVLTGFADFEYARTAINLEVMEYVLKPVEFPKFMETLEDLEKRVVKKRKNMVSVEQLLLNRLVSSGEQKKQLDQQILERLGIRPITIVDLFLIKPDSPNLEIQSGIVYLLKRKLNAMFIENFHVFNLPSNYGIFVAIVDVSVNQDLKNMFSTRLIMEISQIGSCFCSYKRMEKEGDIGIELHELEQLFQYSFSWDRGSILTKEETVQLIFEEIKYPKRLEQQIKEAIRNQNMVNFKYSCEKFIKQIIKSQGRKKEIIDFTVTISYVIYEMRENYISNGKGESSISYLSKLMLESKTREELLNYFNKLISSFSEEGREQLETENLIILKVISYIRNNYKYDISLSDAADFVGITPIYLSKLFVKEININFVAFLRDFRISVAKRMLAERKYKIGEIAEKIGFNDPKYFNKVFKSVCGVSPSEYKREGDVK